MVVSGCNSQRAYLTIRGGHGDPRPLVDGWRQPEKDDLVTGSIPVATGDVNTPFDSGRMDWGRLVCGPGLFKLRSVEPPDDESLTHSQPPKDTVTVALVSGETLWVQRRPTG